MKTAEWVRTGTKSADGASPLTTDKLVKGRVKSRWAATEVIVPDRSEIASNPRSSSAKFRWACLKGASMPRGSTGK